MVTPKKIYSNDRPQEIEITETMIFLNKNITEYQKIIDGHEINGYEYDCFIYPKDEYIKLLIENASEVEALKEELAATKILLGVE